MGLFDWLRRTDPVTIAAAPWQATLAAYPFLAVLTVDEKKRLKSLAEGFLAEKEFSTVGDLVLSDDICLAIAAQGCLPILELGLSAYRGWVGIVVYPDEFVVDRAVMDEAGVVHQYRDVLSGEAWAGGPLLLSWRDVQAAGHGYNVVIHEFAHKLDMLNGEADGLPALHSDLTVDDWERDFFPAWDDFCNQLDAGQPSCLDPYASEAPEEFFAVSSEVFFEQPAQLAAEFPAWYALLRRYYRQDPLARLQHSLR